MTSHTADLIETPTAPGVTAPLGDRMIAGLFVLLLIAPLGWQLFVIWTGGKPAYVFAENIDDYARISVADLFQSDAPKTASVIVHEGWYFYNANGELKSFQGQAPLEAVKLQEWKSAIDQREQWLSEHHCEYFAMITPDKQTIHPERLPPDIRDARGESRLDQWTALWPADSAMIIDLRKDLKPEGDQQLYHPDDTHWNHEGAYLAYASVMRRIAHGVLDKQPLPRPEFDNRIATEAGDLPQIAGTNSTPSQRHILIRRGGWQARSEPFRWPPHMTPKRYPLDWQQPQMFTCPGESGVLLLIGDSFTSDKSHLFVTTMCEHFGRTIIFNNNEFYGLTLPEIQAIVEEYGVTVVLECRAERFLQTPFTP